MTSSILPSVPDLTHGADDIVVPFHVEALALRGRVVRFGPALSAIIHRHGYPSPVARLLGEAVALAALLGSALKFDGRLILQTQTDGPVRLIVADFATPNRLRALVRFDAEAVQALINKGETSPLALMGKGALALTIDQGVHMQRYQGVVALDGQSFEAAGDQYFRQSEQIPTRIRLAVAENITPQEHGWRAGGILVQSLPEDGGTLPHNDLSGGDLPEGVEAYPLNEDDRWTEGRALVETVEDIELVDPTLSPERLLFRLFHEQGVRVFPATPLVDQCTCSRERLHGIVRSFTDEERKDMIVNDRIEITCEYCSTQYVFAADEIV
jgi:molecular chaperone Hsp33